MHAKPFGGHAGFRDRRNKLQLMLRRIRRNDETHAGRAEVVTPALLAASADAPSTAMLGAMVVTFSQRAHRIVCAQARAQGAETGQ